MQVAARVDRRRILTVQKKNYSQARQLAKKAQREKITPDPIAGRIAGGGEAQ
jgi:hypothetical protein